MAVPFEMLSAPGALIPSLTNLIAAYANKTRSERERAREDKHRDFAQRLQLRGMELQEQNAEFHREATQLERERRHKENLANALAAQYETERKAASDLEMARHRESGTRLKQNEAVQESVPGPGSEEYSPEDRDQRALAAFKAGLGTPHPAQDWLNLATTADRLHTTERDTLLPQFGQQAAEYIQQGLNDEEKRSRAQKVRTLLQPHGITFPGM